MKNESVKEQLDIVTLKIKKYKLLLWSLFFLWLLICTILLIFAQKPYIIYLIINIILTLVYWLYATYYFLNTRRTLNKRRFYLVTINNATILKEYLTYIGPFDEKEIEGIKVYRYKFVNLGNEERILSSLEKLDIEKQTYYLESKIDYILSLEVYHEEK